MCTAIDGLFSIYVVAFEHLIRKFLENKKKESIITINAATSSPQKQQPTMGTYIQTYIMS